MGSAEAQASHVFEMWAYGSDAGPCVVQTEVVDGVRRVSGTDCQESLVCIDAQWEAFASLPVDHADIDATNCDALAATLPTIDTGQDRSENPAWSFVIGGLSESAVDSQGDTPVLVSTRLDPRVATWEIRPHVGLPIGPEPTLRHPDDADWSYLFALVPNGWSGMKIDLRDATGAVLGQLTVIR